MVIEPWLRYPLLRYAIDNCQCAPQYLSAQQRQRALEKVTKAAAIEAKLASRFLGELASVSISDAKAQLRAQFVSSSDYQAALSHLALDGKQLDASLRRALQAEQVLQDCREQVSAPTERELHLYYQQHPQQFYRPERRTLRHILKTVNEDFADNQSEPAEQWIYDCYQRLTAQPGLFAQMAERYSECPSALKGGLLGTLGKEQLYPELATLAFSLPVGVVSEPVRSPMGFHLLLCDASYPAVMSSFEQVREPLLTQLWSARQQQAEQQLIRSLLKELPEELEPNTKS